MQWIVDRLAESVGMTLPRQPALVHIAFVKQKRFCLFAEVRLIVCRRCWLNAWLGLGFLATHGLMRNFVGKTIIETLFFCEVLPLFKPGRRVFPLNFGEGEGQQILPGNCLAASRGLCYSPRR